MSRHQNRLRSALRGDQGAVTVEAALGIASIATVLVLSVLAAGAALTQIQLVDAAREAARIAAISGAAEGESAGRATAPSGASVTVDNGALITAVARAPARGLPGMELSARAVASPEPGVGGEGP